MTSSPSLFAVGILVLWSSDYWSSVKAQCYDLQVSGTRTTSHDGPYTLMTSPRHCDDDDKRVWKMTTTKKQSVEDVFIYFKSSVDGWQGWYIGGYLCTSYQLFARVDGARSLSPDDVTSTWDEADSGGYWRSNPRLNVTCQDTQERAWSSWSYVALSIAGVVLGSLLGYTACHIRAYRKPSNGYCGVRHDQAGRCPSWQRPPSPSPVNDDIPPPYVQIQPSDGSTNDANPAEIIGLPSYMEYPPPYTYSQSTGIDGPPAYEVINPVK